MDNFKFHSSKKEIPVIVRYAVSILVWALLSTIFLFILTWIAYKCEDPVSYVRYFPYAALYLSIVVTGALASKITREGEICALIVGTVAAVILFLASLFFERNLKIPVKIVLLAAVPFLSWISSVLFKKRHKNTVMARYKKLR